MSKKNISVTIYNEAYILTTEADEAEVKAVADLVDKKMLQLSSKIGTNNTEKVAVWTALDLAAELHALQIRYDKLLKAAREK